MALWASGVLFFLFVANVVLGSATGSPVLGDVPEMLILFAASICFVAAILRRETEAQSNNNQ